tara:strand:- start:100 stop:273 length:174 start_codon:yes stop_codon:yes gene_type:complete
MTYDEFRTDNIKNAIKIANEMYSYYGGLSLTGYKMKVDTYANNILHSWYQDYKAERD